MLHCFLPLDGALTLPSQVLKDKEVAEATLLAGAPFLTTRDDAPSFHRHMSCPGIVLSMSKPSMSAIKGMLSFRWHFMQRVPTAQNWSGHMDVRTFATGRHVSAEISSLRPTKTLGSLPEDILERDTLIIVAAMRQVVSAYVAELGLLGDRANRMIAGAEIIAGELAAALRKQRGFKLATIEKEAARDEAAIAAINALPEGTPLVIRRNHAARQWQLGRKRGPVARVLALNSRIATPEELHSEALRAAGLSLHQILPLDVMAREALESHPEASAYRTGPSTLARNAKLVKNQPFHDSFHDPLRLKARRDGPKFWLQTTRGPFSHYFVEGIFDDTTRKPANTLENNFGQSFPHHPDVSPRRIQRLTLHVERQETPRDMSHFANIWCLSEKAAEVLSAHNIPGSELRQIHLFRTDNKTEFPGPWYQLLMGPAIRALRIEPFEPHMNKGGALENILPWEAEVYTDVAEGHDLWWDDRLGRSALCMSGRLKSALAKAKVSLPFGLKPCQPL